MGNRTGNGPNRFGSDSEKVYSEREPQLEHPIQSET